MLRAGEDDGLVSHFYASALGNSSWTEALERLTAAFGGRTAVLSLRPRR